MNHRRKLALAAALALLFGSAAASAANYAGGKGAMPSFSGAGDALGMAVGGVTGAWMRSRNAVDEVLAVMRPQLAPLPEVEAVSGGSYRPFTGARQQEDANRQRYLNLPIAVDQPDHVHPASFDGVLSSARAEHVLAVDVSLPALPGGGGGGRGLTESKGGLADRFSVAVPEVMAPVPEPESYALLLAGLGLMGALARRRKATIS